MTEEVVSIVKWVQRTTHPMTGECLYYRDELPHMTNKLCEATIHDVKYFVGEKDEYEIVAVTKKQLFEARLADK